MRRLNRMEELIEKMKVEGKDMDGNKLGPYDSESSMEPDSKGLASEESQDNDTDVNRFIGSAFWRSLTNEVGLYNICYSKKLSCSKLVRLKRWYATGRRSTPDHGHCFGRGRPIARIASVTARNQKLSFFDCVRHQCPITKGSASITSFCSPYDSSM